MSYAVLFKIHLIDAFVLRQLERLKARVGHGDLYVMVDETQGEVGSIPHDRVIRVSEREMVERGFVSGTTKFSMFWHNTDYSLYCLDERFPDYDYCVMVEYDAVVNIDIDRLVDAVAAAGLDFVGQRILTPVTEWAWRHTCDKIYDLKDVRPYLTAIAVSSRRATALLRERRLELSRQFRDHEIDQFPLSEALVATELLKRNYRVGDLSEFGDTTQLDWWPPLDEAELGAMAHCTFIHPVLAGTRYVDALLRDSHLYLIFAADSATARKLRKLAPRDYIPKLMPKLINQRRKNRAPFSITELPVTTLFERPDPAPNIALGKPATQSSVSAYSRSQSLRQDAAGAVNGLVTGTFGCHTDNHEPPWWMVDLERLHRVAEIWVFNRLDVPRRARGLTILVSQTGRDWAQVYQHDAETDFGGAYGEPLSVRLAGAPLARFVRIELPHRQYLHLDQVKIFGAAADQPAPALAVIAHDEDRHGIADPL